MFYINYVVGNISREKQQIGQSEKKHPLGMTIYYPNVI